MATYNSRVTSAGETAETKVAVPPYTVQDILGLRPWYSAYRGSGCEFPEHTMLAYDSAIAAGAQSIEVVAAISSDGELFCLTDSTLERTTTGSGDPSTQLWADLLANVRVDIGAQMIGPAIPNQNLTLLRDVLDRYIGTVVIFLETRFTSAVTPIQQLVASYGQDGRDRVVWKAPFQSTQLDWAKQNNYFTWGYIGVNSTPAELDARENMVDIWGVPDGAPDAKIQEVVDRPGGKPVMVWAVHRRWRREKLLSMGVAGIMTPQYQYVTSNTARMTEDDFDQQRKAPGNFPTDNVTGDYAQADTQNTLGYWMKFDQPDAAYMDRSLGTSCLMGAFCPIDITGFDGYIITWEMMMPTLPVIPDSTTTTQDRFLGGMAFSRAHDEKYTYAGTAMATGGYHMVIRMVKPQGAGTVPNFQMLLRRTIPGQSAGVVLTGGTDASMGDGAIVAGTWYTFQVQVGPTQVITRKLSPGTAYTITGTDSTYRGGYFHMHNGNINQAERDTGAIFRYRNFTITKV